MFDRAEVQLIFLMLTESEAHVSEGNLEKRRAWGPLKPDCVIRVTLHISLYAGCASLDSSVFIKKASIKRKAFTMGICDSANQYHPRGSR